MDELKREVLAIVDEASRRRGTKSDDSIEPAGRRKVRTRTLTQEDLEWMEIKIHDRYLALWHRLERLSTRRAERMYKAAGRAAARKHAGQFNPRAEYVSEDIRELMRQFTEYQLNSYLEDAKKLLDEYKKKGEFAKTLFKDDLKHMYNRYRKLAPLMATWVNVKARNMGAVRAYRNAGYRLFKWVAQPDACPVCRTFHNQVIDASKGELFAHKGHPIEGFDPDTGQTARTKAFEDLFFPPAHPRCRCEVIPIDRSKAFADRVYAAIGTGIRDHKQAIKVGKIIHEEIDRRLGKTLIEQERLGYKKWNFLDALVRRFRNPRDRKELRKVETLLAQYRKKRAEVALDVLREIRDFGYTPEIRQPFDYTKYRWLGEIIELTFGEEHVGDIKPDRIRVVEKILHGQTGMYLPRAWLALSSKYGPMIPTLSKEMDTFYFHTYKLLNLNTEEEDTPHPEFDLLHEMGHRMERVSKRLMELKKQFYEERTKDDDPEPENLADIASEWEGKWVYDDKVIASRKGKRDRFIHWYQMMYPGTEILSTGLQSVFDFNDHRFHMSTEDPEYYRFILGLLAGV